MINSIYSVQQLEELRKNISQLLLKIQHLFDDTIKNNIAYANANAVNATDDEIENASKKSFCRRIYKETSK